MKPELMRLSQEIAAVHRTMFGRQAALRGILADLGGLPVGERIPKQQEFMRCSAMEEARMELLREELKGLQKLRQEKIDELNKLKSAREVLEKLREKALQKHTAAMDKLERKELDENSRLVFSRGIIERRVAATD